MSNNTKNNSFLIQGTILAIAAVLVRIIGIIYRIPLQNIIGNEGMGYYSTAYEIYAILLIISSNSMPAAVSKLVSARVAKKEYRSAYKIFICGVILASICGGIAAILTYVFAGELAGVFKLPAAAMALRALTPTLFLVAIMGIFRGFFQGFGTMLPTAVSQIIEKVIQVILSLILCYNIMKTATVKAVTDATVNAYAEAAYGATLGNAFGALACLGFLIFTFVIYKQSLNKKMRRYRTMPEDSYATCIKLLIVTILPILLSTTINNISSLCDNYIVGNVLSYYNYQESEISSLLGILSGKYRTFITLPVSVSFAIAISAMPSMSAAMAVGDKDTALSKISSCVRFIYTFSAPCAVGIMILAFPLLQLLYYDGITGNAVGVYLLWIGGISIIFSSLVAISNAIIQGLGDLKKPVINCAIGLVVHIVVAVILMFVFRLSVYAIAVADIALSVTTLILNYIFIRDKYGYKQEIRKTFIIPTECTLIMGCFTSITYYTIHAISDSRFLMFVLPVIVSIVVYIVAMILLKGITKEDITEFPKGELLLKIFTKLHLM